MGRAVIPFYGAGDRALFAIERAAMDRAGLVVDALDRILPGHGAMLDVGAGDGFTASRLARPARRIVALEPAAGMIDGSRPHDWVRGAAPDLPFADGAFAGAYSTWAFFFPGYHPIETGLDELERVVRSGGPIVIVDNAGDDEFERLDRSGRGVATDLAYWQAAGFDIDIVETAFEFDSTGDARRLLTAFFGPEVRVATTVGFRVAVMVRRRGTP